MIYTIKKITTDRMTLLLVCIIAVMAALASCKKNSGDETPGGGSEQTTPTAPNTIYGAVTDAVGKPLSGVKVRAVNVTGSNFFVEGFTNAQGKYSFQLTGIGGWNIYAWKSTEYKNQHFNIRLANKDEDYNSISTNGGTVKKDFVWKLSGIIPDRAENPATGTGYFGACMRFVNDNGMLPRLATGTKVTVFLVPVAGARYLDGTIATTSIIRSFTITGNSWNYYLTDIPGTEYRVSATSELNGLTQQVYLGPNDYAHPVEWVEFFFDSADANGSLEGGYMTPNTMPWYMGLKQ